jgi:beta-glucanase (GH16 family)
LKFIIKLLFLSFFIVCACNDANEIKKRNFQLVWQDEFEGASGQLPDLSKWAFDIGTDWGNAQLEYDTDCPENASLDGDGHLAIIARREDYAGQSFTSARIKTHDLYEQTYGRFEARIKLPSGQGIWPAFWLLGSNIETVGWPQCGEIDIMEYRGQEPTKILGTVHGPGYSGGEGITKSYTLKNESFDAGFHIFAIEWGTDYINFYVDDVLYNKITQKDVHGVWVYDHPFFIIMNVAVGGSFVGSTNDETIFPQTMLVDYVRVYKEVN